METPTAVDYAELGQHLVSLREKAGLKQAELARKITWSPALLSRVENGERPLAEAELQTVLDAIDTQESKNLQIILQRHWTIIPRPPLDHCDQDLLWNAERIAKKLSVLREKPESRSAFVRRLTEYISEIQKVGLLVANRNYQIAFIGSIGIGKSTAICRATGLEISDRDGESPAPVLEAGAGGITICEVHLRTGPDYGLIIEPRSDADIRADVADFAEYLQKGNAPSTDETEDVDSDAQGISKEIERAIRNMSGLKIRREKKADGKRVSHDEAKELAQELTDRRELIVEILDRMELHKRDHRDVWHEPSKGKSPLLWLKDTFEAVNNGRHPEFTLPKRIEVVIPEILLGISDLTIRIIDTKGIDRTAARADLENHLEEPHTLTVLCSGFNNAPAAEPRLLLERAHQIGIRSLQSHAALLVLPRSEEALAVKDESGIKVETIQEGYELKGEQVAMALQPLVSDFAVCFFNAYQDEPEQLRVFFNDRLSAMRQVYRDRLDEIITNADKLLENHEQEQVQEVLRHAASMLKTWAGAHGNPSQAKTHLHDSLLEQMANVYASTIRATIRREGEWNNLNYSHHLGIGARRMAVLSLKTSIEGFSTLCKTMIGSPEYTEAHDLINQAERVLLTAYDEILRKTQLMGQTSFGVELKTESEFWEVCDREWGQGPGYRDRVISHNRKWFDGAKGQKVESLLSEFIKREWTQAISRMTALLENDC